MHQLCVQAPRGRTLGGAATSALPAHVAGIQRRQRRAALWQRGLLRRHGLLHHKHHRHGGDSAVHGGGASATNVQAHESQGVTVFTVCVVAKHYSTLRQSRVHCTVHCILQHVSIVV